MESRMRIAAACMVLALSMLSSTASAQQELRTASGTQRTSAAEAINAQGKGRAHTFVGDLKGEVEAIHKAAEDALGGIDILVANTGGPPARTPLTVKPEEWVPHFEAMVVPVIRL